VPRARLIIDRLVENALTLLEDLAPG